MPPDAPDRGRKALSFLGDAAVIIRDALLEAQVPTVAFVNKRAISAGAPIEVVHVDGNRIVVRRHADG